jgi:hypothetical protein
MAQSLRTIRVKPDDVDRTAIPDGYRLSFVVVTETKVTALDRTVTTAPTNPTTAATELLLVFSPDNG